MNMPLFVEDIRRLGCLVGCACVQSGNLGSCLPFLKTNSPDLVFFDYLFPPYFINELKRRFPLTVFATGGSASWDVFTKSAAEYCVIGAGREAAVALARAVKEGGDTSSIANVFFKTGRGKRTRVDYSGRDAAFELKKEIFPYEPWLDWSYYGFDGELVPKAEKALVSPPPLIADFGCPYRGAIPAGRLRSRIFRSGDYKLTGRAMDKVERILEKRQGGCGFCTYDSYVNAPVPETVNALIGQAAFLQKRYGYDAFAVNSEYPFPFLVQFIQEVLKKGLRLKQLNIRSRADWLLRHKDVLSSTVKLAKDHDFRLVVWQMGFESFLQKDLDLYSKGVTAGENVKALRLLKEMRSRYRRNFSHHSHGFIGVHPWTSPQDLLVSLSLMRKLRAESYSFPLSDYRLCLYDPFMPLYGKIEAAGLLLRKKEERDDFIPADRRMRRFLSVFRKAQKMIGWAQAQLPRTKNVERSLDALLSRIQSLLARRMAGKANRSGPVLEDELFGHVRRIVKAHVLVLKYGQWKRT